MVQAANVVLPELLHGESLTPDTHTAVGSEPTRTEPDQGEDKGESAGGNEE